MSNVLLYRPAGRPTGRQIAKALGLSYGTVAYFDRKGRRIDSVAIRWGGAERPNLDTPTTLNKAEAIRLASSKLSSFRRFNETGVPIPDFTTDPNVARGWETDYLGRTSEGFQGKGICVYRGCEVPQRHQLYVRFIPNEREYRLHVCRGVVISFQRKYLERPELKGDGYIKNHAHGYVFATPKRALNKSRQEAAVAAVEALGLDFGAVDMVVDKQGQEYVLEVNTAPALSPLRIEHYVKALRECLR